MEGEGIHVLLMDIRRFLMNQIVPVHVPIDELQYENLLQPWMTHDFRHAVPAQTLFRMSHKSMIIKRLLNILTDEVNTLRRTNTVHAIWDNEVLFPILNLRIK